MNADKKYLTQISSSDLREIAAVANMQPGLGIELNVVGGRMEVSIDRQQLTMWVKAIISGKEI